MFYKFAAVFLAFLMTISGCAQQSENVVSQGEIEKKEEKITIFALGDNLLHMYVVNSGKQEDGSYDFSHLFSKLRTQIQNADLAIIGQETIFGGDELGFSGYPLFNSPTDMGRCLVKEGFDVVLHASNHALDKGVSGAENTINFWKNYPQITMLGLNESENQQQEVKIVEVKGAKLALLNYTYDTNGIMPPKGKEYIINYIDEEKIKQDVMFAEENADFTIVFPHWGEEYSKEVSKSQKELAQKMCEWGVDLVIGAHPHVLEPVEWISTENGNSMLVYYSLGNFVSRQQKAENVLGGAAKVELTVDDSGVKITEDSIELIVTHYNKNMKGFTVYPLDEYTDDLAYQHGVSLYDGNVSIERFKNIVDDILGEYLKKDEDKEFLQTNIAE